MTDNIHVLHQIMSILSDNDSTDNALAEALLQLRISLDAEYAVDNISDDEYSFRSLYKYEIFQEDRQNTSYKYFTVLIWRKKITIHSLSNLRQGDVLYHILTLFDIVDH